MYKFLLVSLTLYIALVGHLHAEGESNKNMHHAEKIMNKFFSEHSRLIVGEVHGTQETPWLVQRAVVHESKKVPVLVGLECPTDTQALLNSFLIGNVSSRDFVTNNRFWSRPIQDQDGRTSQSMLVMLKQLKRLKHAKRDIDVFCFAPTSFAPTNGVGYEMKMYNNIKQRIDGVGSGASIILYMGNYHAAKNVKNSVGAYLHKDGFSILFVGAKSGSAWSCVNGACKSHKFNIARRISKDATLRDGGRAADDILDITHFSSSFPAAQNY